jgi:hypothetical protein
VVFPGLNGEFGSAFSSRFDKPERLLLEPAVDSEDEDADGASDDDSDDSEAVDVECGTGRDALTSRMLLNNRTRNNELLSSENDV